MSEPQGTPVSMQAVLEVQRQKIAQLVEENIMLLAALNERDKEIAHLRREE